MIEVGSIDEIGRVRQLSWGLVGLASRLAMAKDGLTRERVHYECLPSSN
jgi:hypothetical protein